MPRTIAFVFNLYVMKVENHFVVKAWITSFTLYVLTSPFLMSNDYHVCGPIYVWFLTSVRLNEILVWFVMKCILKIFWIPYFVVSVEYKACFWKQKDFS